MFPILLTDAVVDCCSGDGIDCDDTGNRVPDRGLRGVIFSSLQSLNTLSLLNLSCNFLSGPLPDGLFSSMNNLRTIEVATIGFLDSCGTYCLLQSNHLISPVIVSVARFKLRFSSLTPNLIDLNVSNNTFTGVIPSFTNNHILVIEIHKLRLAYNLQKFI